MELAVKEDGSEREDFILFRARKCSTRLITHESKLDDNTGFDVILSMCRVWAS